MALVLPERADCGSRNRVRYAGMVDLTPVLGLSRIYARKAMSCTYFRKAALAVGGIVLSILLTAIVEGRTNMGTPGAYLAHYVFPPRAGGGYDLGLVLCVVLGADFLFFFAVVSGAYLLFTKLFRRRNNDTS